MGCPKLQDGCRNGLGGTFDVINYDAFFFDFSWAAPSMMVIPTEDYDTSHKRLGSRFEFRENLEAGYEITPRYSALFFVDRLSNAVWLSRYNRGLETAGVYFNAKFDQRAPMPIVARISDTGGFATIGMTDRYAASVDSGKAGVSEGNAA